MASRELTVDEVKAYIKAKGLRCPFCGAADLVGSSVEVNDGYASQEMSCPDCGEDWQDLHALTGVMVVADGHEPSVIDVGTNPPDEPDAKAEADRLKYVAAARRQYQEEGSIEIDDNAKVSGSSDGGATGEYVQAWVWVEASDAGVTLPDE